VTVPFLSIDSISKRFGDTAAIEDVSLDIEEGEFVTFLGPSGSGKSTTLSIIAGFFGPTDGDVLMRGRSILGVPSNRRNIGMVFQRYTLFPHLSVAENVAFPLRVRRRSAVEIEAKVGAMLKLVRLEGLAGRKPSQLSGGQQQRVALARALAYDPPLLLMDEPLSALDKKLREELQVEVKRIHRETGVTILYVTHDQEEALRLSDRIAVFNHGRIEQLGQGRELYDVPRTRFIASFIGASNFVRATIVKCLGDLGQAVLPDGTMLDGVALDAALSEATDADVMLRPDHLRIVKSNGVRIAGVAGVVRDAIFLGSVVQFTVRTAWGDDLSIRAQRDVAGHARIAPGDKVVITPEPGHARAFARH
jgi:putative spermidine/putrescine transport system ATP-binding protein